MKFLSNNAMSTIIGRFPTKTQNPQTRLRAKAGTLLDILCGFVRDILCHFIFDITVVEIDFFVIINLLKYAG